MNTVVITKEDSIRDAFTQGGRMYYYLTEETIEQTFVTTEQVYDLSKLTAKQLTGLLKNCLVKPVTELPKPKGYDQWVADGKQMPVILSTDKKIDLNSLVNQLKVTPRYHREGYNHKGQFVGSEDKKW